MKKYLVLALALPLLFSNQDYLKVNAKAVIPTIEAGGNLNSLLEGVTYTRNDYEPNMMTCSYKFVNGKLCMSGGTGTTTIVRNGHKKNVDAYSYAVFLMGTVDVPYQSQSCGYLSAGYTHTFTVRYSDFDTYEQGMEYAIKSSSFNHDDDFSFSKIGFGMSKEIEKCVKTYSGEDTSITCDYGGIGSFCVDEDGYYKLQKRAYANMYIVASYENVYSADGTISYKYLGYNVYYKIKEVRGIVLTKYKMLDTGFLSYDDIIDSSCLRYI